MASSNAIHPTKNDIRGIIAASCAGTVTEWYDFYLFASLSTQIAANFFPKGDPATATLATFALFAAGFVVRPFGARVFGRAGDLAGRKYAFLLTPVIMGGSTFLIGFVPGFERIGVAAPLSVLLLRLLQGLALGVEYGGAANYVVRHSPDHRRGFFTSWIPASATLGLLLSLGITLATRFFLDRDPVRSMGKFDDWGWRVPFLVSIFLAAIAIYFRLKMRESTFFPGPGTEGGLTIDPAEEGSGNKAGPKPMLIAIFGATLGQAIVFYTGQIYVRIFMETACLLDPDESKTMLLPALLFALPFFVLFAGWSDRVGRKWIMMAGMLLAVITYPYLFKQLLIISDPGSRTEYAEQKEIRNSVAFLSSKSKDMVRVSITQSHYEGGFLVTETKKDTVYADSRQTARPVITVTRTLGTADYWKVTAILFVMILFVTMACGPATALLVEMFPLRTGYDPISLPDHIGGIFGGMTPFLGILLTTIYPGEKLAGLWYPIAGTAVCLIVGVLFIPNKKREARRLP
jgi:MFS family permease